MRNIAQKGPQQGPVYVYNRTTSKATALVSSVESGKATVASSIEEAVKKASLIFICLGEDPSLLAVIDEIVKVLSTDSSKTTKTIVDCTTVHPDTSKKVEKTLSQHGAAFVACPVFGAPPFADMGLLVTVVAGPPAAVNKVKPYLTGVTSKSIIDMSGQDVGRASLMKVLGNSFILNMVESLGEALVVAEKSGLGTDVYQQWVDSMFPGPIAKYADRMLTGDYYQRDEPLFAVDLARKDLRHALSLAKASDARLRSIEVAEGYLNDVKAHSGEKGDVAGVYGAIRKDSGLQFENQEGKK